MKIALSNLRTMGSKAIFQFLCHHKLYDSVHMCYHPDYRLCDNKLMDAYHFYNVVQNKALYHGRA